MHPRRFSTGTGTNSTKAPSPTPPNGPNTRRTTRNPTTADEIEQMQSSVMDAEQAEKFLTSKLLCQEGQPYSSAHLSTILFHITQMSTTTPLPVNTAIRAVAFLLKRNVAYEIAEVTAKHLTEKLSHRIVDHVIAAIAPQVANIHSLSESLSSSLALSEKIHQSLKTEREEKEESAMIAAERIEEAADALFTSVEDCQNAMKVLSPSLDATQDRINHLSTQMTSAPTLSQPTQTHPHPSYSSIVTSNLPPKAVQAVGRAAIRARQILLDPKPGISLFPPNTTNSDIAKKMKNALSNIRNETTPPGDIKAISTLRNGGIIVELETENLAAWLRDPENRTLLEGQFDAAISFRTRTYSLVLEYLPIQTQIENENFIRQIEEDNDLPTNSLSAVRWIKPTNRRSPSQSKAFALLQVFDATIANDILRDGICIANERITIRKDKKEPIRCAKCQGYGHIARSCTAKEDTCGTCAEQHRTSHCNAYRTTRCVNCRSLNHTSWSRKCPEFIRRCEMLDERYPENRMPYFPTESAWTHAIHPPRPPRTPTPAAPSPPSARPHNARTDTTRQTTLTFPPSNQLQSQSQPQSQSQTRSQPTSQSLTHAVASTPTPTTLRNSNSASPISDIAGPSPTPVNV